MNIKIKAAIIVLGIMASGLAIGLAVQLAFTYIPLQILGIFGALVVAGFMLSLLYTIILTQLKNDENIEELSKKYKVDRK
jgi:uncharacterized membrane protein YeiB